MESEAERVASLTEAEKEVLRLYLRTSGLIDVARAIGKSEPAVEQRFARARRRLGVRRTLDAANMLARVEGGETYGSGIYAASTAVTPDAEPPPASSFESGGRLHGLAPFPTKGRPWNDLPIWARLVWIGAGMLLVTIAATLAVSLAEGVTRIFGR